jgi:hypothetical protein
MNICKTYLTLVFFCFAVSIFAQDAMLEVQVSKDSVYYGNQVKVTFVASNVSGSFNAPDFEGFEIINGPFTSSSYSFINGSESRKTTYAYVLEPITTGKLKIGKASFKGSGQELSTSEISIFVKANPNGIKEAPDKSGQERSFGDMFEGFGSMDDFFNMPEMRQYEIKPKENPPAKKAKTYKFKTEKI